MEKFTILTIYAEMYYLFDIMPQNFSEIIEIAS